jgi:hypothetical protein
MENLSGSLKIVIAEWTAKPGHTAIVYSSRKGNNMTSDKKQGQAALQNPFLQRENLKKYRPRLVAISRVNRGTLRDMPVISSITIDNWTRNIWPCCLGFNPLFHKHGSLCNEIEPISTVDHLLRQASRDSQNSLSIGLLGFEFCSDFLSLRKPASDTRVREMPQKYQ